MRNDTNNFAVFNHFLKVFFNFLFAIFIFPFLGVLAKSFLLGFVPYLLVNNLKVVLHHELNNTSYCIFIFLAIFQIVAKALMRGNLIRKSSFSSPMKSGALLYFYLSFINKSPKSYEKFFFKIKTDQISTSSCKIVFGNLHSNVLQTLF